MVQRGHAFAIVDEVDSILIDEARTPLIISGMVADSAKWYQTFARIAPKLKRDEDYEVEESKYQVAVTESGVDQGRGPPRHREPLRAREHPARRITCRTPFAPRSSTSATTPTSSRTARCMIVDEFTGRVLEGRRYSEGLHQAIEAKEGVRIKEENQTLATITIQNYFRMYDKLAGMTGTAMTEAAEFARSTSSTSSRSRRTVPMVRERPAGLHLQDRGREVRKRSSRTSPSATTTGQPVLVGTARSRSPRSSRACWAERGVEHEVLNAKHHEREAMIVAQAGRLGAVTVATANLREP